MKLNRKGYMLVEIVLASVLAMGVAYYLLNLTYKFKNTNEDIYQSVYYENDKMLITRNIMSDLENGTISSIDSNNDSQMTFELLIDGVLDTRRLEIQTISGDTFIKYGKYSSVESKFDTADVSYYEKKITAQLVGDLNLEIGENGGVLITIPISTLYDNKRYDIKLFSVMT